MAKLTDYHQNVDLSVPHIDVRFNKSTAVILILAAVIFITTAGSIFVGVANAASDGIVAKHVNAPRHIKAMPEKTMPSDHPQVSESAGNISDKLSAKGADTCLKCHDEDNEPPVFPIFKTKHGQSKDPSSPMAGLQCEACHGPGDLHAKKARRDEDGLAGTIVNFGLNVATSADVQNQKCLSCHTDNNRGHWPGSAHEEQNLSCASCHQIHVQDDPVMSKTEQTKVCVGCHTEQRAQLHKRSRHPIKSGQMQCSDCHQPHGSVADKLLVKEDLNKTCYSCHAEKRGPFLWQHAPVDEDCSTCHTPHGSNQVALLKSRPQLMCRQCHSPQGHPSMSPSSKPLPGGNFRGLGKFLLGKSCLNCHSQIHGSNHPSGSKLTR